MADPNDSDGSWEFVDKDDSDSETSSESLPYDSGLPDETQQNEDELVGSAWNNREEFVTDSDIEACEEEPAESDGETDVTVIQNGPQLSNSAHEDEPSILQASAESSASSSSTVTKSLQTSVEENMPLPEVAVEEPDIETIPTEGEENESGSRDNSDDSKQEVTCQEAVHASPDDIIQPTDIDSDQQPSIQYLDTPPLSNVSSHSDFERIATPSDIVTADQSFEPGSIETLESAEVSSDETTTVPKSTEDGAPSDESDAGSVDFAVISAPPPAEITSHETGTSESANHRSVGMVTVIQWTNPDVVDTATGPEEVTQKTVGMVTDHAAPPNQRLLISIIMISFGVGFLVGRCPVPSSTVFMQYKDHYALVEKTAYEDSPQSIQHIYHGNEAPPPEEASPEYIDSLMNAVRKAKVETDLMKFVLTAENSKLKNRNRHLRFTIRKLKKENSELMKPSEEDDASTNEALVLLRNTCNKQQRLSELNLENKEKKIQQLTTELRTSEELNELSAQNAVEGYKHLIEGQLASYELKIAEKFALEKTKLLERQHGMKLRLQRYRIESKKLIQELGKARTRNAYLQALVGQNDILQHPQAIVKQRGVQPVMSPLLQALFHQSQTCRSGTKFKSQARWLRLKLKGQRSIIRKLDQEVKLKSMALEMLYIANGELSNYAACMRRQIDILPSERMEDAYSICRPSMKPSSMPLQPSDQTPLQHGPQCSYPINGTLSADFSSINITVMPFADQLPSYELKIISDTVRPNLVVNATPVMTSMCDLAVNLTSDFSRDEDQVPKAVHTREVKKSAKMKRKLENKNAEFVQLRKACAASNRSLEVARQQKENVKGRLHAAKEELKRLRMEKQELNRKLRNATSELKKKSSIQNCLKSALDTDAILERVNGTRVYKAASKMAQKVQRASGKAWNKFKKFVSKFGDESEKQTDDQTKEEEFDYDDDYDETIDKHQQEFKQWNEDYDAEIKRDHKSKANPHKKKKNEVLGPKPRKQMRQGANWKQQPSGPLNKKKQKEQAYKNQPKTSNEKRKNERLHQKQPERTGNWPQNKQEKHAKYDGPKPEHSPDPKGKKGCNKNARKQRKRREEYSSGERYRRDERRQGASTSRRNEKHRRDDQDKKRKNAEHRDFKRKSKNEDSKPKNKKQRRFRDAVKKHVDMAKKAGENVVHHLMPIYDGFQKLSCDIEKRISQKSLTEIWESLTSSGEDPNDEQAGQEFSETGKNLGTGWHWSQYENFTEFLLPIIELPGKLEFPVWGGVDKDELVAPTARREYDRDNGEKVKEKKSEDVVGYGSPKDPQWFTHMFQAREDLRKDWGESPLSEEEFDWFLQMFEAREELRQSGEEYPNYHGNGIDNGDLDWFLKMFEARARLRFKDSLDEKNWYLKMSEAREKARSEGKDQRSATKDWYENMFKARESMRGCYDNEVWYYKMASEREKARYATTKGSRGDWYEKRMRSRQKSRESDSDTSSQEWCQA